MLSILNELTLLKELQNCVTNNVFWDKKYIDNTNKQKLKHKTLAGDGS